jgi:nicotinic acid phosphoribosyltransferase
MGKIEKKQIMKTFIRMIDHISDKEYQKRAWIKGEEADFDEAVCLFFGDGDPILENYKDFGITEPQYKSLKRLRDEFRVFSNENYFPEEFIDTLEWAKIMELAKSALKEFNYHKNN